MGFQCGSLDSSANHGIPVWILGFLCGFCNFIVDPGFPICRSWDSSLNAENPVWALGLQWCSWCYSPDPSVSVLILEFSFGLCYIRVAYKVDIWNPKWFVVFQCGSWDRSVSVWILEFQCEICYFSKDPVWILEFQSGCCDISVDPGIGTWILGFQCES